MSPPTEAGAQAPKPLFPRALERGDRVAVVSPSSPLPEDRRADLDRGLQRLRDLGLRPVLMPHALDRVGYLAGDDRARTSDLQDAIDRADLRAILCVRGGYGAMRLLPRLDLSPLRDDPKPIVGFSDATALLAAAWRELGLVTFHGPMVAQSRMLESGPVMQRLQWDLLRGGDASDLPFPSGEAAHPLRPGTAEGRLVGGNLSLVCALIGTPWEIDTTGHVLALEDVGESPYRVDRMLTQLRLGGFLQRCAAVVLGDFHVTDTPWASVDPEMHATLRERLADLRCPVAAGFPFGHRPSSWTLPLGVRVRLEADDPAGAARLSLLERPVRS